MDPYDAPWHVMEPGITYNGLVSLPLVNRDASGGGGELVARSGTRDKLVVAKDELRSLRRSAGRKIRELEVAVRKDPLSQMVVPLPMSEKRLSPENYSGLEIHGFFGLIDTGQEYTRQRVLIIHVPPRVDAIHMLSLQVGEEVDFVYLRGKKRQRGKVYITWLGRSKYHAPGRPITSMQAGVSGWIGN